MTTAARVQRSESAHWYGRDGSPQYEMIGKTTGRPRAVTIRDARENDWVPGVSTVLRALAAPGLEAWKQEQLALVLLTTPRKDGEATDAFVHRVLHEEKQQDAEAAQARELGTRVHAAIESALNQQPYDLDLQAYIEPAIEQVFAQGRVVCTERIVVGDGYAGKLDAMTEGNQQVIWDFKTARNLPTKGSWPEAKLQLSAYAKAIGNTGDNRLMTANLYVSTSKPGDTFLDVHGDWPETYERGFRPLLAVWQWLNDYRV